MKLYAKIGTHSATYIHVCRKRKPPAIGEHFYFKEPDGRTALRWLKEEGAVCDEIRDVGGQLLYVCERM